MVIINVGDEQSQDLVCTKKEQTRQECIKISGENLNEVEKFWQGSKITWDGS